MNSAVSVSGVSLRFGQVTALSDVSFEVADGELFAIIGPNGAGKSSLFNVLTGLYPATEGTVHLLGSALSDIRLDQLAKHGIVRSYQNLGLFRSLSVLENLLVGRHPHMRGSFFSHALALPRARREERQHRELVSHVLETFGLSDLANRPVDELSYGTQKRVELARCVAASPKLLLLDEPVAGMGTDERHTVTDAVTRLHRDLGTTTLLIEHDMGMVMGIAERVLVLDFGEVIASGKPADIQNDPRVIGAYLGDGSEATL